MSTATTAQHTAMTITIDDGKYTVIQEPDGRFHALRFGEEWRDLTGDKLVYALASELENTRQMRAELLQACQTALDNLTPKYSSDHLVMVRLRAAIAMAMGVPQLDTSNVRFGITHHKMTALIGPDDDSIKGLTAKPI